MKQTSLFQNAVSVRWPSHKEARCQMKESADGLISKRHLSNQANRSREPKDRSKAGKRVCNMVGSPPVGKKEMLTLGQAIRKYCIHCCGGIASEVPACDGVDCPFHMYRMGKGKPSLKVIRKFCLECMGGSSSMVADCQTTDCLCHPYRCGKSLVKRKGRTAEEMKQMRAKRTKLSKENGSGIERSLQGEGHTLR